MLVGDHVHFGSLPVGASFHMNGNHCVKQSTRTARICAIGKTFYYGQKDIVKVVYLPL